jgi:hypothetical protein
MKVQSRALDCDVLLKVLCACFFVLWLCVFVGLSARANGFLVLLSVFRFSLFVSYRPSYI